jgi:hypothetical protein
MSSGMRSRASVANATNRPSLVMARGPKLSPKEGKDPIRFMDS